METLTINDGTVLDQVLLDFLKGKNKYSIRTSVIVSKPPPLGIDSYEKYFDIGVSETYEVHAELEIINFRKGPLHCGAICFPHNGDHCLELEFGGSAFIDKNTLVYIGRWSDEELAGGMEVWEIKKVK